MANKIWNTLLESLVAVVEPFKAKLPIIVIIIIASYIIYQLSVASMHRFVYPKLLENRKKTFETIGNTSLKGLIYIIAIFSILQLFGLSGKLLVAVSSIGTVAIGFGAKTLVSDMITGILIILDNDFQVGDVVEIKGKMGNVKVIGIRTTILENSLNGELYIFPNSSISTVTNHSVDYRNAVVLVPLPYECDLESVVKLLSDALIEYEFDGAVLEKPVIQGTTEFTKQGIVIRIICKSVAKLSWDVERDLRLYIKTLFEDNNISMVYIKKETDIIVDENKELIESK